ncbi:MAG: hypothetical protein ACFN40_06745 [Bacteroidota bacterium]
MVGQTGSGKTSLIKLLE